MEWIVVWTYCKISRFNNGLVVMQKNAITVKRCILKCLVMPATYFQVVKLKQSACVLSCYSHVQLSETPWTVAHQVPLSLGFSRQEYLSGLPCPPPGDPPDPGIKPASLMSPALTGSSGPLALPGKLPFPTGSQQTGGQVSVLQENDIMVLLWRI